MIDSNACESRRSLGCRLNGTPPSAFRRFISPRAGDAFLRWLVRRPVEASAAAAADGTDEGRRTPKLARLEAALFVAEGALSTRKLAQLATLADAAEARELIDALNAAYSVGGSAFRIERVATGYQMLTRPEFAPWLNRIHRRQTALKLSPPAMETLTIVAYRQPVTRADIEAVRGVQCSEMLKQLMERGLVRIAGEDDSLGRPYLYETTRRFLELFGLRTLDDLPLADRLRNRPSKLAGEQADTVDAKPDDGHKNSVSEQAANARPQGGDITSSGHSPGDDQADAAA